MAASGGAGRVLHSPYARCHVVPTSVWRWRRAKGKGFAAAAAVTCFERDDATHSTARQLIEQLVEQQQIVLYLIGSGAGEQRGSGERGSYFFATWPSPSLGGGTQHKSFGIYA